jgi:hypothetical protein
VSKTSGDGKVSEMEDSLSLETQESTAENQCKQEVVESKTNAPLSSYPGTAVDESDDIEEIEVEEFFVKYKNL